MKRDEWTLPPGPAKPLMIASAKQLIADVDAEIRAAVDRVYGPGFHDWYCEIAQTFPSRTK